MIPQKTTLAGAVGIRAGLNRDSITIDFSGIPGDAVSVAIRGDNGAGKSTLLNLGLHPFRNPPHIDDIYSYFGETGERVLEFTHGGKLYKSEIIYKQTAKTKSTKAALYIKNGDAWEPVTTPDGTISDGKTSTYDAALEFVLGPQSIYFMSAFKCQNAKPLADHDDPKSLMRDLLNLAEPDAMSARAKEVAKHLKQKIEIKRAAVARVDEFETAKADALSMLNIARAEVPVLTDAKQSAIDELTDARVNYESARTENQKTAEINKRRAELDKQRRDLIEDQKREAERINADIERNESRIIANKHLLGESDAIKAAETRIPELEVKLSEIDAELETLREREKKVAVMRADVHACEQNLKSIESNGRQLKLNCESLQRRHEFVDKVPCKGAGEFALCPALRDAIEAGGLFLEEKQKYDRAKKQYYVVKDEIEAKHSELIKTGDPLNKINELNRNRGAVNVELMRCRETAAKRHALQPAENAIKEATAELDRLRALLRIVADEYTARAESVTAELAKIPPVDVDDALSFAHERFKRADQALTQAEQDLQNKIARIATLEADIERAEKELANAAQLKTEFKTLVDEAALWELLAMALKGVIDLSIEDAGPSISAIANKLLFDAYGPRFTVRIVTQKTRANGTLAETFDISVIDAESGIESSIIKKSGGEMVWLDKALTDAVALYHKDAAGIDYECLFADEAEDGLTEARKEQFYKMDRAALTLGGYKRKFFISHNPAAWELADHVINLSELRA